MSDNTESNEGTDLKQHS